MLASKSGGDDPLRVLTDFYRYDEHNGIKQFGSVDSRGLLVEDLQLCEAFETFQLNVQKM